ncbi:MAG: four helix bundle protein [Candidatus Gracilibacteria bacterium]|nr:four helix bundle protein [Candidatus Gracilibacteria bacterium]
MATYDNLPVYKTSYDLLLLVFNLVKEFKKEYKYTLGDIIKKEIINLISNIYKANSKQDKQKNILLAREKLELLRLYIRLCKDLKIINLNRFVEINLLIESISKQLVAWDKSLLK